jgi:hypothetical protein
MRTSAYFLFRCREYQQQQRHDQFQFKQTRNLSEVQNQVRVLSQVGSGLQAAACHLSA